MSQASVLHSVIHPKSPANAPNVRPLTMTPVEADGAVLGNELDDLSEILSVLVENTPVGMAVMDRNLRYLLANRQWVTDYGLQNQMPLVGRSQFEVLPNLHPGWRSVYDRALNGHVVRNEHDVMQDPLGRPVVYRWEVRPLRLGKDTSIIGVMITAEKFAPIVITQEVPAESPVTAAQEVPAVAPSAPPVLVPDAAAGLRECGLPVLVVDIDGVIHQANPAAERLALQPIQPGVTCFWEAFKSPDASILKNETIAALAQSIGSDGLAPASFKTPHGLPQRVVRWAVTNAPFADDELRAMVVGLVHDETPAPAAAPVFTPPPVVVPADNSAELKAAFAAEKQALEEKLRQTKEQLGALSGIEETYKRREVRQREVLDTMPCGLLVLDERGRPTFQNAHVRDLFGRELKPGDSVEEWLAQACLNETHREEIARIWRESVWRRQLTKILSLTTADGLLKDVELRPVPLPNNGLLVTIHDVTETSRLEEMLRSAEAKFRTVLHDSPVAVVLTDSSGAIFEVNASAERLLKQPRAELRRMSIDDWLDVDGVHERRAAFARLSSGVQPQTTVHAQARAHGSADLVPVTLRIAAIKDSDGRFHAAAHFLEPVVSLPTTVIESLSQTTETLSPEPEPVLTEQWITLLRATEQGRILEWSEQASSLFGYTADEVKSRWLHHLFRPSDATGFLAELAERRLSGEEVEWCWYGNAGRRGADKFLVRAMPDEEVQLQVLTKTQEAAPSLPAEAGGFDIASGRIESWAVVDLDRERLMLSETHHRIKNHLQLISSFLSLQSNCITDELAKQALKSSQNRVRAVAALHHHLYQLAQGEPVSLQEYGDELVCRLRECHDVPAEQVEVDLKLHGARPKEEWIMPIVLVLNEAISNSFKHAYANGRTGRMEVRLTSDGERMHLTVEDDGPGLPDDFDPAVCSGLGLKVAGVFADQMKGKIHLKNIIPNGLFFDLQFPIGCVDN